MSSPSRLRCGDLLWWVISERLMWTKSEESVDSLRLPKQLALVRSKCGVQRHRDRADRHARRS